MGLTAELGAFVATLRTGDVPEQVIPSVRRGIADTVAVSFAALEDPVLAHATGIVPAAPAGE